MKALDQRLLEYARATRTFLFISVALGVLSALLIVAQAGLTVDKGGVPTVDYKTVKDEIDAMHLPIGWSAFLDDHPSTAKSDRFTIKGLSLGVWALKAFGWLLTAFAVTLGAPFWFDVLNRVMVIRSTVKPHEKSPEEASEDRQ